MMMSQVMKRKPVCRIVFNFSQEILLLLIMDLLVYVRGTKLCIC